MNKRILLVEDNPVSREFLHEALKPLAVTIDIADTLANACLLAGQHEHVLFLCDVHLPDGGPLDIFQALKQRRANVAIVAITAEANPAACSYLKDMGYLEVWGKPITMAMLQNNVSRLVGIAHDASAFDTTLQLWDEASALRAVGNNIATLTALRNMFRAELPQQMRTIELAQANQDTAALKGECHKLLASCGFVGAARLADAVKQLSENSGDIEKLISLKTQAHSCLA